MRVAVLSLTDLRIAGDHPGCVRASDAREVRSTQKETCLTIRAQENGLPLSWRAGAAGSVGNRG